VVFMLKEYGVEYHQSLALLARDRANMAQALAALPDLIVFLSQGNFLLVKLPDGVDGATLRDRLLTEHGVFIRECGNKLGSSSQFLRLVVRPHEDVQRLLTALQACLPTGPTGLARHPDHAAAASTSLPALSPAR
jgi:threonine-phosphate decarboxylase